MGIRLDFEKWKGKGKENRMKMISSSLSSYLDKEKILNKDSDKKKNSKNWKHKKKEKGTLPDFGSSDSNLTYEK
jgi:hypothetical protein